VNLCIHKLSEKLVAIKSLDKQYLKSEHNNSKLQNEIAILSLLKHKNVISLYETFSTQSLLLIVIELCIGGDLLSYVRKRRKLSEPVAKLAFRQVFL
jgi:serine/threonine protein kinase